LAYTKHGYATLVDLKSLVLNARVSPLGWGHPVSDTLRF